MSKSRLAGIDSRFTFRPLAGKRCQVLENHAHTRTVTNKAARSLRRSRGFVKSLGGMAKVPSASLVRDEASGWPLTVVIRYARNLPPKRHCPFCGEENDMPKRDGQVCCRRCDRVFRVEFVQDASVRDAWTPPTLTFRAYSSWNCPLCDYLNNHFSYRAPSGSTVSCDKCQREFPVVVPAGERVYSF